MKFDIQRSLNNKVFTTSIIRIPVLDDACAEEEKILENDFGPVEVEVGGKFEAIVTKELDHLKFTPVLSTTSSEDRLKANFKFSLDPKKVILKERAEIAYSCNALNESLRKHEDRLIDPLRAAEEKCKVFEAVIKERIELAVAAWKAQQTNFETEEVASFEISLC